MSIPAAHIASAVHGMPTVSVDIAAVFEARCWARARLFAEGEFGLIDAVDVLQEDAVRGGLTAALGQDGVQAMMDSAFTAARQRPTAWDLGEAYDDHRGVLDAATVAELDSLTQRNDPQQFRTWMARLSVAERQAVRDLLVTA